MIPRTPVSSPLGFLVWSWEDPVYLGLASFWYSLWSLWHTQMVLDIILNNIHRHLHSLRSKIFSHPSLHRLDPMILAWFGKSGIPYSLSSPLYRSVPIGLKKWSFNFGIVFRQPITSPSVEGFLILRPFLISTFQGASFLT